MDFDTSDVPETIKARMEAAIASCDFPWEKLVTPYAGRIIFRMARLSTFASWSSQGYININIDTAENKVLESYVVHELGHAVDELDGITDEHRRLVRMVFHDGTPCTHPWLERDENQDNYTQRVGEAWANLFVRAYSPLTPPDLPFIHRTTLDRARLVRSLVTPDLAVPQWLAKPARNHNVVSVATRNGVSRETKLGTLSDDLSVAVAAAKAKGHKVVIK